MTSASLEPDATSCPACGSAQRMALPTLGLPSMLSDGRLLDKPLAKVSCGQCGLLSHARTPDDKEVASYFDRGYSLYDHEPGSGQEASRQRAYANWIAASIETEGVREIVEAGCGNGSMLLELSRLLPAARLRGVEPAAGAARNATIAGVVARHGFAEDLAHELQGHDLVISINVMEHSAQPARFLAAIAIMAKPGGQVVVVCPDGSIPSTELLFFDHFFSFTPSAFLRFAGRSGLEVKRSSRAPLALGPFRLYELRRETATPQDPAPAVPSLHAERTAYLHAWKGLDEELVVRIADAKSVTCFGAGETALLLRAYAPQAWGRVRRVTVDTPANETFCGLPVAALGGIEVSPEEVVLLGARPADQPMLAERLACRWGRVIRWDDIVAL